MTTQLFLTIREDAAFKSIVFSSQDALSRVWRMRADVADVNAQEELVDDPNLRGLLPPLGVYEFHGHSISTHGMVLSPSRQVIDADDILTPFWRTVLPSRLESDPLTAVLAQFLRRDPSVPVRRLPDDKPYVNLANPGCQMYGHWLLDILPMAWMVKRAGHLACLSGGYRVILPSRTPGMYIEMLTHLLSLEPDQVTLYDDLNEVLNVPHLVVPSMLWVHPRVSPRMGEFINDLTYSVKENTPSVVVPRPKRIYLSREAFRPTIPGPGGRWMSNAAEVWATVAGEGFVEVHPEQMDWREQIHLFRSVDMVVAETGSGLHNAIFSGPGTTVIGLSNSATNNLQDAIAALRGHRLAYVRSVADVRSETSGLLSTYDAVSVGRMVKSALASKALA